jgi:DNA-binding transcriptional regulator LsrR (DeoR family)
MPHQTIRPAKRPAQLQPAGKATHPLTAPRPPAAHLRNLYATRRMTDADIADVFGVSVTTVRRWRLADGLTPADRRPPATELRRLYDVRRLTVGEMAAHYRVSYSTMHRWLTEAEVTFRQGPPRIEIPEEES